MQEKYKEETTTGIVERLSERLYKLTRNTNGEALFDQWESDRKAIKQGLGQVGRIFPHYSLHDESHCRTILNNIVMLVGEELIFNLSATDIWLLLSAVYFHDTGMILTNEEEQTLINEGKLAQLVKDAQADPQHAMHGQAINFEIDEDGKHLVPKTKYVTKDWTDDYTFLLAELVRKGHAVKAGSVIDQNKKGDAKDWLRTSKLPNRLYEILKRVCYAHGDDFSAVMALPDEQSGLDTECFHPRFIAAMLRMGDLLDVDHKRFSEVMLAGLSKMPESSQLHMQKHASITQFSIRKRIEIIAELEEPGAAEITQTWFEWIENEYKKLSLHWASICVFTNASLPTLGKLSVEVKNHISLGESYTPNFTIDTQIALEYLTGENLYLNTFACIQELFTNSLDAIKIRAHYEHPEINNYKPNDSEFLKIMDNYKIEFEMNYIEEDELNRIWEIQVIDTGCGMNIESIKELLNVGKSSKKKIYNLDKMSTFIRPSGAFGVGFQSIFMLTENVIIQTKDMFTNESYQVNIHKRKKTNGNINVRKIETDFNFKGTKIIFKTPIVKTHSRVRHGLDVDPLYIDENIKEKIESNTILEANYFFVNESEYLKYTSDLLVTIHGNSEIKVNKQALIQHRKKIEEKNINYNLKWSKFKDIEFSYDFKFQNDERFLNRNTTILTYVNGFYVENYFHSNIGGVTLSINIFGLDPNKHIHLNRKKFKSSFYKKYSDIITKCIIEEIAHMKNKNEHNFENGVEVLLSYAYRNLESDYFKDHEEYQNLLNWIQSSVLSLEIKVNEIIKRNKTSMKKIELKEILEGSTNNIKAIIHDNKSNRFLTIGSQLGTPILDTEGSLYVSYKHQEFYDFILCYSLKNKKNNISDLNNVIHIDNMENKKIVEKFILTLLISTSSDRNRTEWRHQNLFYMPTIARMQPYIVIPKLPFAIDSIYTIFNSIFNQKTKWISPIFNTSTRKFETPQNILKKIHDSLVDQNVKIEDLEAEYVNLCDELNNMLEK